MILPTKYIRTRNSLLGLGALLLLELKSPRTVSSLWEQVRQRPETGNFQRMVAALDLLFMIGAVSFDGGLLRRRG